MKSFYLRLCSTVEVQVMNQMMQHPLVFNKFCFIYWILDLEKWASGRYSANWHHSPSWARARACNLLCARV